MLNAVNLIKLNRYVRVKVRLCTNGSKQKRYLKYGDIISSPTFSLEGLFTTMVIYSYEGREVVTFDVPGAYFHDNFRQGKHILLKLRGDFLEIMFDVNPEHIKNVICENR